MQGLVTHDQRACAVATASHVGLSMASARERLSEKPVHFPECCPAISKPLLNALIEWLPKSPALILSVGSGIGFLEATLLQVSNKDRERAVNIRGVEVESCANKYLPEDLFLTVPSTNSLHADAMLATTLMFVYLRDAALVEMYLDAFMRGSLEKVLWLGPQKDWSEIEERLRHYFSSVQLVGGPGIAEYELLAIASTHKYAYNKVTNAAESSIERNAIA